MFRFNGVNFEIDENGSQFYTDMEDGHIQFALDIKTTKGEYRGEKHAPSLDISWFDTEVTDIQNLAGIKVSVTSIEEADEREDTFYLYEHEPFVEYKLEIIDVNDNIFHVRINGTVVEDGHAKPYTTAPLEIDCFLKTKKPD